MNRRSLLAALLVLAPGGAPLAHAAEAEYEVRFENLWNPGSHPNNYPGGSAHFSPLVGASHAVDKSFWAPGGLASPGVEAVAELGVDGTFRSEVNTSIAAGDTLDLFANNRNLFQGAASTDGGFRVSSDFPLVTLLSMIAPSSDWFVGVHGVDLRDGAGFVESLVFEFTTFYDAGTEEGAAFSLSNPATSPQQPISLVGEAEAARVFVGANASTLPPIARLTLTRTSQAIPEPATAATLLLAAGLGVAARRRR